MNDLIWKVTCFLVDRDYSPEKIVSDIFERLGKKDAGKLTKDEFVKGCKSDSALYALFLGWCDEDLIHNDSHVEKSSFTNPLKDISAS